MYNPDHQVPHTEKEHSKNKDTGIKGFVDGVLRNRKRIASTKKIINQHKLFNNDFQKQVIVNRVKHVENLKKINKENNDKKNQRLAKLNSKLQSF
jgi:hypothetical protein